MKANINRIFSTSVLIFLLFFSVASVSGADRPDEYVPYEGAVDNVDLGNYDLDAGRITSEHFVSGALSILGATNTIYAMGDNGLGFESGLDFSFGIYGQNIMSITDSLIQMNRGLLIEGNSDNALTVWKSSENLKVFRVNALEELVEVDGNFVVWDILGLDDPIFGVYPIEELVEINGDLTIEGELLGSRQNFQFGHKRVARGRTYLYMEGNDIQCSEELGVPMIRDGSIVGASVVAQINGVNLPVDFDVLVKVNDETVYTLSENVNGNGYLVNHGTQERGVSRFNAGDLIQVEVFGIETGGAGRYRYSNVQSMVEVQFDN
jgi:hypothetical protein